MTDSEIASAMVTAQAAMLTHDKESVEAHRRVCPELLVRALETLQHERQENRALVMEMNEMRISRDEWCEVARQISRQRNALLDAVNLEDTKVPRYLLDAASRRIRNQRGDLHHKNKKLESLKAELAKRAVQSAEELIEGVLPSSKTLRVALEDRQDLLDGLHHVEDRKDYFEWLREQKERDNG